MTSRRFSLSLLVLLWLCVPCALVAQELKPAQVHLKDEGSVVVRLYSEPKRFEGMVEQVVSYFKEEQERYLEHMQQYGSLGADGVGGLPSIPSLGEYIPVHQQGAGSCAQNFNSCSTSALSSYSDCNHRALRTASAQFAWNASLFNAAYNNALAQCHAQLNTSMSSCNQQLVDCVDTVSDLIELDDLAMVVEVETFSMLATIEELLAQLEALFAQSRFPN